MLRRRRGARCGLALVERAADPDMPNRPAVVELGDAGSTLTRPSWTAGSGTSWRAWPRPAYAARRSPCSALGPTWPPPGCWRVGAVVVVADAGLEPAGCAARGPST